MCTCIYNKVNLEINPEFLSLRKPGVLEIGISSTPPLPPLTHISCPAIPREYIELASKPENQTEILIGLDRVWRYRSPKSGYSRFG